MKKVAAYSVRPELLKTGRWLALRREHVGLKQSDINRATGISVTTLSRVEHGRQEATTTTLQALAPLLKLDYEVLLRVKRGETVDPATDAPQAPTGLTAQDIEGIKLLLAHKDELLALIRAANAGGSTGGSSGGKRLPFHDPPPRTPKPAAGRDPS